MRRMMSPIALGLALCVFVGAGSVLMPERTHAAQAYQPVQVVNTSANPVPVTGSVTAAVTGNVNAAITGAVSLASGTTIHVDNTAASPAYVKVVESAPKQPVSGSNGEFFSHDSGAVALVDLYTVPVGYRLVVEHISGRIELCNEHVTVAQVGRAYLDCCIGSNDDYLVPQRLENTTAYQVNHQTLIFFDAGDTVRVMIGKDGTATGGANFSFAGYLVPVS